jgi:hypothetical protein
MLRPKSRRLKIIRGEMHMPNKEKRKIVFLKLLIIACGIGSLLAFSSGPPLAHTGAFGEPTCQACHIGNGLNVAGGTFAIHNVPLNYNPGQTYVIQVTLTKSGQQRWGFELAARANANGQQAGTLATADSNTQVTAVNGIQYIEQTSAGTFLGSAQGTWTFHWTAPAVPVGRILFAAAGNAANGNFANSGDFIYTTSVVTDPAPANPVTLVFPQVAIGGGYTTVFNLLNTGGAAVAGDIALAQGDGSPMIVTFGSVQASSTPVSIPPGGAQQIIAGPLNATEPTRAGWGRVESSGGTPGGVGTFQFAQGGVLQTIVGVLSSPPLNAATIPINDNVPQGRSTGYAFANPGAVDVNIKIVLVDSSGTVTQTVLLPTLNPLKAGGYYSAFLNGDLNSPNFQFDGSIVAIADGTNTFSVTALVLDGSQLTAIPVIAGKAPGVN